MQRESLNTRQGSKAGKIRVRTGREKMRPPPLSAKEKRLRSNSTPRFLTDDEQSTMQSSSVRQCSRLLLVGVLGPIINASVFFFQNLVVRNYSSSTFLY